MNKTIMMLVTIAVLSGCASRMDAALNSRDGHVDLSGSDSASVAMIRGSTWDIGVASIDCWIKYPVNAKQLTIRAGIANIFAVCKSMDMGSDNVLRNAAFNFEALEGHEYLISQRTCKECIQLRDVTANKVVAENPHNPLGRVADLSTGDNTATIEGFTYGVNDDSGCWLTDERFDFLVVDAGPVTIDSTCTLPSLNPFLRRGTSSFDFAAETGHTYKVSGIRWNGKEKCMRLLDITSEEIIIACEPYEEIE